MSALHALLVLAAMDSAVVFVVYRWQRPDAIVTAWDRIDRKLALATAFAVAAIANLIVALALLLVRETLRAAA